MSEMEMTAEHLVIVGRGKVLADVSMSEFIAASSQNSVRISSPDAVRLTHLLAGPGVTVTSDSPGHLEVSGTPAAQVGELAAREGLVLHELVDVAPSLEEAFMELTRDAVEYHGSTETTERTAA
jgi:ABC-2 type transport system ATP-binding protein